MWKGGGAYRYRSLGTLRFKSCTKRKEIGMKKLRLALILGLAVLLLSVFVLPGPAAAG